jgi:hypothetical protein
LPEIEHTRYCVFFFLVTTCLVWPITLHVVPADASAAPGTISSEVTATSTATERKCIRLN